MNKYLKMFTNDLQYFFKNIQKNFSQVLTLNGCREGWLQGEMYRYFSNNRYEQVGINEYKINRYSKVDFHTKINDLEIIAEIKISGTDYTNYQRLTGCGSDIGRLIDEFGKNKRMLFEYNDVKELFNVNKKRPLKVNKDGYILKDIIRLKSIKNKNINKFMILVIHLCEDSNNYGEVIKQIKLSNNETNYTCNNYLVRIWKI